MSAHHVNGSACALCDEKILTLDPKLQPVARFFKLNFPEGHISWGFRDEANQNDLFAQGKTRATFPHSAHNKMKDAKPCAEAFDIFRVRPDGVPEWKADFCQAVWNSLSHTFDFIEWAGNWHGTFRESDHFQLKTDGHA